MLAVADELGCFPRGDVAPQLAVDGCRENMTAERSVIERYRSTPTESARPAVLAILERVFQQTCDEPHHAAVAITGEGGRMGTTLDVLLSIGKANFVAHVGDGCILCCAKMPSCS